MTEVRQVVIAAVALVALVAAAGTGFAALDGPRQAQVDEPTTQATETTADGVPIETETTAQTETAAPTETPDGAGTQTEQAGNASFNVTNLSAPAEATVGDSVEVTADVTNPNAVQTTKRVEFRLMGELVERREVTLAAGETRQVNFTLDTTDARPGTYVHSVLTAAHGEVALITLRPAEDGPGDDTEANDTSVNSTAQAGLERAAAGQTGTESGANETVSVTFENQTADGRNVTVAEATLPEGGFAVVHNESGEVVGASEYLEAGTHENVTVEVDDPENATDTLVAMLHRDSDENREFEFVVSEGAVDRPYTVDDQPVTDEANVTFET